MRGVPMSVGLSSEAPERAEVTALYGPLLERLAAVTGIDDQHSALVEEAVGVWSRPGSDTVLSGSRLAFTPFDYQLATMQRQCCAGCGGGRSWPTRSGWARRSRPGWCWRSCGCAAWPTARSSSPRP